MLLFIPETLFFRKSTTRKSLDLFQQEKLKTSYFNFVFGCVYIIYIHETYSCTRNASPYAG